ncbi:hypothetical protein [Gordonia sp. (in: high G+C Gram-positive bacteria)]|uniref:hypothetical protein n=1 Tax=Gordonia sp. (in: high G+C Gram-positive bacteria) TaxID=84139 RepID=UPI003C76EB1A
MTIIHDRLEDVAGEGFDQSVTFTIPRIREAADGSAIVTEERHRFNVTDGELITTDLDPGPATVRITGHSVPYKIVIPPSGSSVRLWPLIDAGMPAPQTGTPGFVRNGGGVSRTQAVTSTEYAAMVLDPATLYVIVDEES